MSWSEVESAFDHLFDVGLEDDEARRLTIRFQRARSQLLPIFSSMVVSPFERERVVALAMLERIGGRATVDMLDDILTDVEVHDAYKLDVRQLRTSLEDPGKKRPRLRHGEEGEEVEEAEPPAQAVQTAQPAPPRAEPGAEVSPAVFEGTADTFLAALSADTPGVLTTFAGLTERKRLSFIDRLGRLRDPLLLGFLLPLLGGNEWALVQSVLTTLGNLGLPEAIPAVEQLAGNAQRKRVQMRAQRVLEQLRRSTGEEPPAEAPAEP
ncbi:MAG: hypothetical protein HYU66_05120, partial [Armatimonadetes bacterium]|nr:hypothetical protein [Armatimonadota bacterium]